MIDPSFHLTGYRDAVLIGQGGLGRVYRAVRETTGGSVAIKELQHVGAASPAWHRARRELDAMLRLKGHPYVVSIEEIVDGPSGPCLVMEYLPGGSLSDRVASGPLQPAELVVVGQHVTQALAAAHAAGVVHRDVKPHNLLIGAFGQVKVCDFGIASVARGENGQTFTQALTLAYASPEELDGDATVSSPADVYSFGATLAHLLTGRKPSFQDRMAGRPVVIDDITVDVALRPVMPVLARCLSHSPQSRPTMAELVAVFDDAAGLLGPRRIAGLAPRV
ncbi:MAG: serine/threonine-protein kinase, partial [Ilumatobacteraceae bacterium]